MGYGIWLLFHLALVVTSASGDVEVVITPEAPPASGSVVLGSRDTALLVPPTEPITIHTGSGDILIEVHTDSTAPLNLNTVSGDLRIQNPPASKVMAHTVSGDVEFAGTPPPKAGGLYQIRTLSGDLTGSLPPVSGSFRTLSGRIHLRFPHPAPEPVFDTLAAQSGDLEVEILGIPLEPESAGVYQRDSYRIVVQPWFQAEETETEEATSALPRQVFSLMPAHPGSSPLYLDYNRVDGFVLRFPVVRHGARHAGLWSQARLLAAVHFGRRIPGEPNRWKQRLGFWTNGIVGLQRRHGPSPFLWGEAWLNQTATLNRWTLSPLENLLGSLLFKADAYDYYLSSGVAAGAGFGWGHTLWLRLGYHSQSVDSLYTTQTFSLFHSSAPFRGNPTSPHTDLQGVELAAEARLRPLTLAFWGFRSTDSSHHFLWQSLARTRIALPFGEFRLRAAAGGSAFAPPSPLAFYLGGPGSLPAYDFHADSGTRFVLANGELSWKTTGPDLLVFGDAGKILGHPWHLDAGVGLGFGPLALRLAVPAEQPQAYRLFLRFRRWF